MDVFESPCDVFLDTNESSYGSNEVAGTPSLKQIEENNALEQLKLKLQEPTSKLLENHQLLPLLGQLKIMSRKQQARVLMGRDGISAVINHLINSRTITKVAAEGSNVILNVCYEKNNVCQVLECGGAVLLVEFLSSCDEELQANAAGALQSICYQPEGRLAVRNLGAIPLLVKLLDVQSVHVKARAVGALHNISSDVDAIRVIRRKGGILSLVTMLNNSHPLVCGSAAGALQNISREVASRMLIRESKALPLLVGLLANAEVQVRVCAVGALLNVLGPEMNRSGRISATTEQKRRAFIRTITTMLLASLVFDTYYCPTVSQKNPQEN
ncbi:unnamed protein product [Calypogeia fissa]